VTEIAQVLQGQLNEGDQVVTGAAAKTAARPTGAPLGGGGGGRGGR
jgi:hypothetical protein